MVVETIQLAGQAGHAIAATVEGARDGTPIILAHGGGQNHAALRRRERRFFDADNRAQSLFGFV